MKKIAYLLGMLIVVASLFATPIDVVSTGVVGSQIVGVTDDSFNILTWHGCTSYSIDNVGGMTQTGSVLYERREVLKGVSEGSIGYILANEQDISANRKLLKIENYNTSEASITDSLVLNRFCNSLHQINQHNERLFIKTFTTSYMIQKTPFTVLTEFDNSGDCNYINAISDSVLVRQSSQSIQFIHYSPEFTTYPVIAEFTFDSVGSGGFLDDEYLIIQGPSWLTLFNISDPMNPCFVDQTENLGGQLRDFAVIDSKFVVAQDPVIRLYDFATGDCILMDEKEYGDICYSVEWIGGYLVSAFNFYGGIYVDEINEMEELETVSSVGMGNTSCLAYINSRLHVGMSGRGETGMITFEADEDSGLTDSLVVPWDSGVWRIRTTERFVSVQDDNHGTVFLASDFPDGQPLYTTSSSIRSIEECDSVLYIVQAFPNKIIKASIDDSGQIVCTDSLTFTFPNHSFVVNCILFQTDLIVFGSADGEIMRFDGDLQALEEYSFLSDNFVGASSENSISVIGSYLFITCVGYVGQYYIDNDEITRYNVISQPDDTICFNCWSNAGKLFVGVDYGIRVYSFNSSDEIYLSQTIPLDTSPICIALDPDSDLFFYSSGDFLVMNEFPVLPVEPETVPPATILSLRNHPNPFNPSTTITYELPASGRVRLEVFNIRGQRVATLVDAASLNAGEHKVVWDAGGAASGVYFVQLTTSESRYSRKILLMK